jgi:hypothetical protein
MFHGQSLETTRSVCIAKQAAIVTLMDECAFLEHKIDHEKEIAATLLPLCGEWEMKLPAEVLRIMGTYLMSYDHVYVRWPRFPMLATDPVLPGDDAHNLSLMGAFPGPATNGTAREELFRLLAAARGLDARLRQHRRFIEKMTDSNARWEARSGRLMSMVHLL